MSSSSPFSILSRLSRSLRDSLIRSFNLSNIEAGLDQVRERERERGNVRESERDGEARQKALCNPANCASLGTRGHVSCHIVRRGDCGGGRTSRRRAALADEFLHAEKIFSPALMSPMISASSFLPFARRMNSQASTPDIPETASSRYPSRKYYSKYRMKYSCWHFWEYPRHVEVFIKLPKS